MNHFTRNKIVDQIHKHVSKFISGKLDVDNEKLKVSVDYYLPINYGDLRWNKKENKAKLVQKEQSTPWDLDNLWVYHKCIQDTIVECGLIPKDDVSLIVSNESNFIEVVDMEHSKIVLRIDVWKD